MSADKETCYPDDFSALDFPNLFGEMAAPKRGAGRPVRVFTKAETLMVRQMLVAGKAQPEIAKQVKCTEPTLRKYFKDLALWNTRNGLRLNMRRRESQEGNG